MLYQWQSGMRLFISHIFFFPGMGRMICCYNVEPVVQQRFPQSIPVGGNFDGRIAFYLVSQQRIIIACKMQMMYAYFCSNPFFLQGQQVAEKRKFLFCTDMKDMQPAVVFFSKLDGGK